MPANLLSSVLANGGRSSRYGEFTVVYMHGGSFITTPMEFMQMQNWARVRTSSGNAIRDRAAFVDHFDTVLGHVGSGIASRGSKPLLSRIVKAMTANAVVLNEWNIPHNLDEGVEVRKPNKPEPVVTRITAAPAPANDAMPSRVTPLVPR